MLPWRWHDITERIIIVPANAKGRAIELTCSWFLVDELGSKDTDKRVRFRGLIQGFPSSAKPSVLFPLAAVPLPRSRKGEGHGW